MFMSRWLVVLGAVVLALLAFLWWKMSERPAEPEVEAATRTTAPVEPAEPATTRARPDSGPGPVWVDPTAASTAPTGDDGTGDNAAKELVDPKSEKFNHRLDVVVGNRLRAPAAFKCDESGMDPDAKIKLNYKIRIVNGRITVSDVRVMESDVTPEYERCFVEQVEAATFRMDDMPDFEEGDQELITRVRSMKKYRSRAEFDK